MSGADWERQRLAMVETQLVPRGLFDARVLEAMRRVPREEFVPEERMAGAYADRPLGIGHGQTISQPYIVARMSTLLQLDGTERVLEIGAGCGYQSAVLSLLAASVCALELDPDLCADAKQRLARLGYANVDLRTGSGWDPWPEGGTFAAVLCACAPREIPSVLLDQLEPGGRLVIPVGPEGKTQDLLCLRRDADGRVVEEGREPVRFVPMR